MPFPEDLFPPVNPAMPELDPWSAQLALIDAELAKPRTPMSAPPPPPGALEAGGVPSAAIDAVAPGSAAKPEPPKSPAPPPYAIAPSEEPAALPPEQPNAPTVSKSDPLPQEEFVDPLEAPEDPGEIEMGGEYVGNPLENPDATPEQIAAKLEEVAQTDPGLAAQYRASYEAKKALELQNEQLEALARDNDRAQQNLRDHAEARAEAKKYAAKLEQEAQQVANERIDTNKWWGDRSTGQKIAGFVAAIVGGLVQSRKGGQNEGLAFIEREIERDIAAQRENLANRRAEVARKTGRAREMFADADGDFQFAETARIGAWGRVARELEIKAQNFDPRGTTALKLLDAASQARAQQAAAMAAAENAHFERSLKVREDSRKERELGLKEKKAAGYGAGVGGVKPTKPEDVVRTPDELAALYPGQDVPPVAMSEKQYGHWLERRGKGASITKSRVETDAAKDNTLTQRRIPGVYVTDDNGNKVEFVATAGTPEEISTVRKQVAATKTFVRLMDEVARIRTGWTTDTMQSPEWQKLRANWGMAIGAAKNLLALGALSGPDMELVEKIMGAKDPTQMRSIFAGLKKARENVLNFTNDSLRQIGMPESAKFDIKDITGAGKPKDKLADEAFKEALKPVNKAALDLDWHNNEANDGDTRPSDDELIKLYTVPGLKPSIDNVVLPKTRAHITELTRLATGRDEDKRREAVAALSKLLDEGGNAGVKALAEQALRTAGNTE